ncbi:MAG: UbiA family prenyltransferase [Saprospiraceae bacterium]|nr:UbiA family prenyltransferase [Saprospiraceae bacterium]
MREWLNLIRWPNLLMILIFQSVCFYILIYEPLLRIENPYSAITIKDQFLLTCFCILVAASGNLINDIYDSRLDWANRPPIKQIIGRIISVPRAARMYQYLLVGGFVYALILAVRKDFLWSFWLYPFFVIALYFYSYRLKCTVLFGNLLISGLVAILIGIPFFFHHELLLDIKEQQPILYENIQNTFLILSGFAFLITLAREIVKDQEDRYGDWLCGCKTTAVGLGLNSSKILVKILLVLLLMIQCLLNIDTEIIHWAYPMILLYLPVCILFIYYTFGHHPKLYSRVSLFLKIYMLFGLFYYTIIYFGRAIH